MSSDSVETRAKTKLAILVKSIEPVVTEKLSEFSPEEIEFVLANYRKHLKYDLTRDFEESRSKNLTESPFDAIINNDLGL